jgi:hypothetical protein
MKRLTRRHGSSKQQSQAPLARLPDLYVQALVFLFLSAHSCASPGAFASSFVCYASLRFTALALRNGRGLYTFRLFVDLKPMVDSSLSHWHLGPFQLPCVGTQRDLPVHQSMTIVSVECSRYCLVRCLVVSDHRCMPRLCLEKSRDGRVYLYRIRYCRSSVSFTSCVPEPVAGLCNAFGRTFLESIPTSLHQTCASLAVRTASARIRSWEKNSSANGNSGKSSYS